MTHRASRAKGTQQPRGDWAQGHKTLDLSPLPWMWIKHLCIHLLHVLGIRLRFFEESVLWLKKKKVRKFPKRPRSRLVIFKQSSLVWNIGSHKQKEASDCSFPTIWRDNVCVNTLRIKKVYVNWSPHKSFNPVWSFLKKCGSFSALYGELLGEFSIIWPPKQPRHSRSLAGTLEAGHDSSCLNKGTKVTTFPQLVTLW